MLGGRLYSPNLMDVALLEDAQLLLLISHTFVCIFPHEPCLEVRLINQPNFTDNVWKIRKLNGASSI